MNYNHQSTFSTVQTDPKQLLYKGSQEAKNTHIIIMAHYAICTCLISRGFSRIYGGFKAYHWRNNIQTILLKKKIYCKIKTIAVMILKLKFAVIILKLKQYSFSTE